MVSATNSATVLPMSPTESGAAGNPRMTVGGKLSFRGRMQRQGAAAPANLVVGGEDPPRLDALVPADHGGPVEIEIGSGKGAFLLAATEARPGSFWLGIEAAPSYAELAALRLQEAARANATMLIDNASLFLRDRCAAGSVERLHVYYPDPWPKRRHRGRRFFRATPDEVMHRVLAPGGLLCVATDNARYAGEITRILGASPLFDRDRDLEAELLQHPGRAFSPTNFETKYLAEGRILRRSAWRRRDVD